MEFTIQSGPDSITAETAEDAVALSDAFWRQTLPTARGPDDPVEQTPLAVVLINAQLGMAYTDAMVQLDQLKGAHDLALRMLDALLASQRMLRMRLLAIPDFGGTPMEGVQSALDEHLNEVRSYGFREAVAKAVEVDDDPRAQKLIELSLAIEPEARYGSVEQAEAQQLASSQGSTP